MLVGTAPKGTANTITVINSLRAAVETFGEQVPGFTIPKALDSIYAQGSARVIVINVFDADSHTTTVADESATVANGAFTLAQAPVSGIVLTNTGGSTTYVEGTHYSLDAYGNVSILDPATIPNGTNLEADYRYLDTTAITDSVVNGSATSPRTGWELTDEMFQNLGYNGKIFICPTYGESDTVANKMAQKAIAANGVYILDAPDGTTVAQAIAGRGAGGSIASWFLSDANAILTYPYVKAKNALDVTENRPYSPYLAGVMARTDQATNYANSPSNQDLLGVLGPVVTLAGQQTDPNSELNQLNEAGITSIFKVFGTGYRTWGNRNASFPTSTTADNFIPVQRTKQIINESVLQSMLRFVDKPINSALIDNIRETVNAYLRGLVADGIIIGGECTYNPADNSATDIANGQLTFDVSFMPPPPAERIIVNSRIDINLLSNLVGA